VRFVIRIACIVLVLLLLPVIGSVLFVRAGGLAGAALSLLGLLWIWLWLPRVAHDAFDSGKLTVAARRYRWLERLAPSVARERAARLSRAGCAVALGDATTAEVLLASLDGSSLAAAERAVYLNNLACVKLAAGSEANSALTLADEANALRPDVPALQHTRAMALLALGRADEAITILDGMRTGGELPARLEADRCRELARAWEHKGHAAYAEDYRVRAAAFSR
jgi:predicted Zn-dependent protease